MSITVSKIEHENMVASADATLVAKCLEVNKQLKSGCDIEKLSLQLSVSYCNLLSLNLYDVVGFNSEGEFNVSDPDHITVNYSNINTINI